MNKCDKPQEIHIFMSDLFHLDAVIFIATMSILNVIKLCFYHILHNTCSSPLNSDDINS